MKSWFALFCLPWILGAAAAAPLITGAVRDQYGDPIAGATVVAGSTRTTTAADGTFSLEGEAGSVRITCAYCAPAQATVEQGGIVVAIVQRYRALAQNAPSPADLQSLPYAHAESAIALTPFVVLNDSARALTGPRLSYFGASRFGGLLVDDGIPAYDIAAGVSALRMLPAYGVLDATLRDSSDAFRYGDLAGGGTFFTGTRTAAGGSGAVSGGKERALTISQSEGASAYAASFSDDGDESRDRVQAWLQHVLPDGTLDAQVLAARDDAVGARGDRAVSDLTALRAHYERVQAQRFYADVVADRAGYDAVTTSEYPVEGQWSDAGFETGVSAAGAEGAFLSAGVRASSGFYDARASGAPRVGGTVTQMHVSAGMQGQSGAFSWRGGIGAFDFAYDGGTSGRAQPMFAQNIVPSVSLAYAPSRQWSLTLQSDSSFRLPPLTEAYVSAPPSQDLEYDRYATQLAALSYSDLRRVRISFVALHRNVAGLDNGPVNAAGVSVAWQVSPAVSFRAWTLHTDDASVPSRQIFRFGAQPLPATPASLWLSYESPQGGLRFDAIWRRDLLDYKPDRHVDASISGPLAGALRWFAGSERRAGTRYFSAGLRYSQF